MLMAVICARFVRTAKHKYDVFFEVGYADSVASSGNSDCSGTDHDLRGAPAVLFNYVDR